MQGLLLEANFYVSELKEGVVVWLVSVWAWFVLFFPENGNGEREERNIIQIFLTAVHMYQSASLSYC